MNQRPSLIEEAGIDPAAMKKPTRGGGGSDPQKIKLVVAIVLAIAAGGVLAWQFGLFGRGGGSRVDPSEAAARQQRLDQEVEADKKREAESRVPIQNAGG